MMTLKIAFRNVFRNRRRSAMTLLTIALGGAATLLLGALMTYIVLDFQTSTVRRTGHLAIFKEGYFQFGAGNPVAYGIKDYRSVIGLVSNDAAIRPLIAVATPMQAVFGVAGNYQANTSKTFFGQGIVPADRAKMRQWNEYGFDMSGRRSPPLSGPDSGIIGFGLGRILALCAELSIPECPSKKSRAERPQGAAGEKDEAIARLALRERAANSASPRDPGRGPRIDLLAATSGGAPNVVSLHVDRAEFQGIKEIDDNSIVMQLELAQRLLYGRDEPKATAVMLQLLRTEDTDKARALLVNLFRSHQLDLEVRDFVELTPLYRQALDFFAFLFTFISIVIGVIVLFTIVNTMSMSVMERTSEIGTGRALGAQRGDIRSQFVSEGSILGIIGASAAVLLATLLVLVINSAGIVWTPPASAGQIPLRLHLLGNPLLVVGTWTGLVGVSTIAALLPANRAASMQIVDSLRHV
jgi:putative ABC transport system permease protein